MRSSLQEEWRGAVTTLAWSPRAFQLHGFLSEQECDHIMKLVRQRAWQRGSAASKSHVLQPARACHTVPWVSCAAQTRDKLEASDVVNTATGKSERSKVRTSTGTFLDSAYDEVILRIEERVSQVTMLPRGEWAR